MSIQLRCLSSAPLKTTEGIVYQPIHYVYCKCGKRLKYSQNRNKPEFTGKCLSCSSTEHAHLLNLNRWPKKNGENMNERVQR